MDVGISGDGHHCETCSCVCSKIEKKLAMYNGLLKFDFVVKCTIYSHRVWCSVIVNNNHIHILSQRQEQSIAFCAISRSVCIWSSPMTIYTNLIIHVRYLLLSLHSEGPIDIIIYLLRKIPSSKSHTLQWMRIQVPRVSNWHRHKIVLGNSLLRLQIPPTLSHLSVNGIKICTIAKKMRDMYWHIVLAASCVSAYYCAYV